MKNIDVGIPQSLTGETGIAVMTAENIIGCYEKEARKILAEKNFPLTFIDLSEQRDVFLPDLANGKGTSIEYSIFWMLMSFENVRACLKNNNADQSVCWMAMALNWASKMQLKPFVPLIDMGESFQESQKNKRAQRRTWGKLSKEDIARRNELIKKAWTVSGLTRENFANIQSKTHGLSITQVKNIIRNIPKNPH